VERGRENGKKCLEPTHLVCIFCLYMLNHFVDVMNDSAMQPLTSARVGVRDKSGTISIFTDLTKVSALCYCCGVRSESSPLACHAYLSTRVIEHQESKVASMGSDTHSCRRIILAVGMATTMGD
jgi:hypothetical protein